MGPPPGLEHPLSHMASQSEQKLSNFSELEDAAQDKRMEELFQELLKTELGKLSSLLPQKDVGAPPVNAAPPPIGLGPGYQMPPPRCSAAAPLPPGGPLGLSPTPPGSFSPSARPGAPLGNFMQGYPPQNVRHGMPLSSPPTAPPSMPPNVPQGMPHCMTRDLQTVEGMWPPNMPFAAPPSMPPCAPPHVPPAGPPSLPPSMPPQYTSPSWEPPTMPPSVYPSKNQSPIKKFTSKGAGDTVAAKK